MSSNKLNLSSQKSQMVDHLAGRLGLRPNIICRLAIGRSLSIAESVKDYPVPDNNGREFNRYTLTGENYDHYRVLIYQHEYEISGKKIPNQLYFAVYFRRHVERGIESLYKEYILINSPTRFLESLIEIK